MKLIICLPALMLCFAAWCAAAEDLVRPPAESPTRQSRYGDGAWQNLGADDGKEAAVVETEGGKAFVLKRKTEKTSVAIYQTGIVLKPQTLYRLSAVGWGTPSAAIKLSPSSSKDASFSDLSKSWATGAAPFTGDEKPTGPRRMEFVFDSGLKADGAVLSLYLTGEVPGEARVKDVSLFEIGSSKPDPAETVILHLGDSITITSYLPFGERVDRVLQGMIEKELPAAKTRQINLGVDGESVGQLLDTKRYDAVVKGNLPKIDVVILRYGANDTRMYDVPTFKKKLHDLCERLKADYPGIRIVLGTGPYCHGLDWGNTRQYGPYWQGIREVAREDGYVLADVFKRFEQEADEKTARKPRDLHPSVFGVKLSAEAEFAALRDILTQEKE